MSQSSPSSGTTKAALLNNRWYNILKHVAMYGLPFAAALYYSLSQIWTFPDVSQVMASIAAVNTVLGGLLGYSTATYNASEAKYAGVIQVAEQDAKTVASLVLHESPEKVLGQAEALFKIVPDPTSTADIPKVEPGPASAHGASA